jgi:hypothetical protein
MPNATTGTPSGTKAATSASTNNPPMFEEEFLKAIANTGRNTAAKKSNLTKAAANELSDDPNGLLQKGAVLVFAKLMSMRPTFSSSSSSSTMTERSPQLKACSLTGYGGQLQPPHLQHLMFNLAAVPPAMFASLFDKFTREEAIARMQNFWHSEDKINGDAEVDLHIVGNNFSFFEHAMSTYCLVVEVLFDLKTSIATALREACARTCEYALQHGNYGLSDGRSSAVFDLVMRNFMFAVHDAYMPVYAGQHKTKDLIAQLHEIPNTTTYSPLWTLLLEVRIGGQTRKRQGCGSNQESQQDVDSDIAAKKQAKKDRHKERLKQNKLNTKAARLVTGGVASNSDSEEHKEVAIASKTAGRICSFFQRGICTKGDSCPYAHTSTTKKK